MAGAGRIWVAVGKKLVILRSCKVAADTGSIQPSAVWFGPNSVFQNFELTANF